MTTPRTTTTNTTFMAHGASGATVPTMAYADGRGLNESDAYKAWADILKVVHRRVRTEVVSVVRTGVEQLTNDFYDQMLVDERASPFLQQDQVQVRLKRSLQVWMVELFSAHSDQEIVQAIRRQVEVGVVHARIRLPVDLISAGIRTLRRQLRRRIEFAALDHVERFVAATLVADLLHLADSLMTQAYIRDIQDVSRNDEAYRQIVQTQSASHEHVRQRAVLAEWVESLMLAVWEGVRPLPRLRESSFGVWLHHKGVLLFEHHPGLGDLMLALGVLDNTLLPKLEQPGQPQAQRDGLISAVKENLALIRVHLVDLFDRLQAREGGVDAETQTAERRFLPAVLNRMIQTHRASQRPFTLALVNVQAKVMDGMDQSHAQKRVMQMAAQLVNDTVRTTDHVFRYGESQYLIVAIETPKAKAQQQAITMRERLVHGLQSTWVNGMVVPVEAHIEIGLAEFDGHPDYQYLLRRTEQALQDGARSRQGIGIAA